ncbi:hypothetical protein ScPMuIL_012302 [Solemya velum]
MILIVGLASAGPQSHACIQSELQRNEKCQWLSLNSRVTKDFCNTSNSDMLYILCFKGLPKSPIHLWANPMLKLVYKEPPLKWNIYYGSNVEEVRNQSKSAGMSFTQLSQYFKMYRDKEEIGLDPFNTSCVGIQTEIVFNSKLDLKRVYLWYVAYLATGIILYFSAKRFSQNTSLHYGTGVSVGVLASLLILIFVIGRLFPQRLRNIGYLFVFTGWSVSMWFLKWISNYVSDQLAVYMLHYWQFITGYIVVTGLISFAVVYRYGPVTDRKSLNLIKWMLQVIGLVFIYNGTQIREISFAFIIIVVVTYNFPRKIIFNSYNRNLWYRFFPPTRRLLTEDEYNREAHEETRRALDELRSFCQSPECDSWKIVSRLKEPQRFAHFIEGDSWHITDDELLEYDSGPEPMQPMPGEISEDESEIDFRLGSL